ncbi:MAG: adenosylcobinamide-GDP ribazoletransferase [Methanomicrobiales archaeon]
MLKSGKKPLRTKTRPSKLKDPKSHGWYRGILGLISFSSILPLNIHTTIEEMARFTWMWPLIGALIGLLVGAVGWLLNDFIYFPPLITAALVYSFSISFTGFHHLDGLIDMGDALMAHGEPSRKIEIMRDPRIGTGGIAFFIMVSLITVGAIYSLPHFSIFYVLFISEIAAKMGLVSCCTISRPFNNGTGMYFIKSMNLPKLTLISFITVIISFFTIGLVGIIGILGGILGGILVGILARNNFGYATGDVLGASNEIGRVFSLLAVILAFIWI